MREIKFRGQRKFENHCWVYGYMVKEACGDVWIFPEGDTYCNAGGDFYSENEPGICMVNPETVGQFTGLKDKNGKEIYEGDILTNERGDILHVVAYSEEEASFVGIIPSLKEKSGKPFTTGINQPWLTNKEKKVIGNIHDNPELLKED